MKHATTHPGPDICDITACVNPPSIGMLRGDIIRRVEYNLAVWPQPETLDSTKQQLETLQAEHEYKFSKTRK